MKTREVVVLPDAAAVSRDMADRFVALAASAIKERGRVSLCLSGGSTPKVLYSLLASDAYRTRVDWGRVHFFWGDERSVPPTHPDSNYRMAHEALLSKIEVPPGNVHRMRAEESDLPAAAQAYQAELKTFFNGALPRFDVMLLGMGPDGHTASLFPESKALGETQAWVVPNWVAKFNTWRMTLTYPVIDNSAAIFFLVGGADKADVLKTVLEDDGPPQYPSQRVQATAGRLVWLVETAAASRLTLART